MGDESEGREIKNDDIVSVDGFTYSFSCIRSQHPIENDGRLGH